MHYWSALCCVWLLSWGATRAEAKGSGCADRRRGVATRPKRWQEPPWIKCLFQLREGAGLVATNSRKMRAGARKLWGTEAVCVCVWGGLYGKSPVQNLFGYDENSGGAKLTGNHWKPPYPKKRTWVVPTCISQSTGTLSGRGSGVGRTNGVNSELRWKCLVETSS